MGAPGEPVTFSGFNTLNGTDFSACAFVRAPTFDVLRYEVPCFKRKVRRCEIPSLEITKRGAPGQVDFPGRVRRLFTVPGHDILVVECVK